jgi:HD-like signal output (HDOD) protein/CheY-like chemotaxis protein
MKRSILFVDDEPKVLLALHRLLIGMSQEWHMEFVDSGEQALRLMSMRQFDVIVSDLTMPMMNGEELLTRVMHQYPQTVRIILCWNSDRPALLRLFGIAHQYLFKPCEAKTLKDMLSSLFVRGELLSDDRLKRLVSQFKSLPGLPSLYVELMRDMRSEDASIRKAGEIILKDLGLTAKILHAANSTFYGLRRQVTSPEEASIYLGIETIQSLVLAIKVFSQFDEAAIAYCGLGKVWDHSWVAAVLARRICIAEQAPRSMAENAFTCGLLHDIGKMVLANNLPELYRSACLQAEKKQIPLTQAEREVFGASHAEVGGFLLGSWGLADPVVEGVTFHHSPSWATNQHYSALTIVHVANALAREGRRDADLSLDSQVDLDYLANMGYLERYSHWQEICWNAMNAPEGTPLDRLAYAHQEKHDELDLLLRTGEGAERILEMAAP